MINLKDKSSELSTISKGYLICLTATALWSSTGVLIRYLILNFDFPPLLLAFWRDTIAFLFLGILYILVAPSQLIAKRKDLGFLLGLGIVLSLFNAVWTVSVALNGAAVSTMLIYSSAAFTALLGRSFFGEQLGWVKIVAVILSITGCAFVSGAYDPAVWQLNFWGIMTGISSGLAFAVYSLMSKSSFDRGINSWTTLFYTFGVAAFVLMIYNLFPSIMPEGLASNELFLLGGSLLGWGMLIFLAIGPTLSGFGLYTLSLGYLPASVANLIATLEPVFTTGLAYIFLGETLTLPQWIGGAMVIGAVAILHTGENKQPKNEPPVILS